MGCFSFMCKECGRPILSNSFSGQRAKLFLLREGKVLQEMEGEYDSYGRVFIDGTQREDVKHPLRKSIQWEDPTPEVPLTGFWKERKEKEGDGVYWGRVCDLMFDMSTQSGMAAIHSKCWKGEVPATQSEDDPNQGWVDCNEEETD